MRTPHFIKTTVGFQLHSPIKAIHVIQSFDEVNFEEFYIYKQRQEMGEKNGDAKTFWMELEDDGKVDFIFEQVQNVLQSLKQKIKDGSATNKEYIQAMILVNEATISNNSTLIKDGRPVTQNELESKSNALPSTSNEDSFPQECTFLLTENKESLPLENEVADLEKEPSSNLSYRSHGCSGACLLKMPLTSKGENPLQLPGKCRFQRRHAKTNSHSSALHVSYKAPCGRSLRNVEEVFRYLLETECNFLFTDYFSFNTYVQLTRNSPKQEEIVSDVDISNGVESVPISFCNEIDNKKLPQFKYRKTIWPRAYCLNNFSIMFTDSCDCSEGCIDITKCACLQLTARNAETCPLTSDKITTGYKYKRLQRQIPTGIYECSLLCKCNRRMCQNRVVQHGPQVRLQVFKTEKKGWGVRCLDDMDRGTFVCIYSGRLLSRANTEKSESVEENGKEEDTMKIKFSKKRKLEVTCSDCEVEVVPLESETHPRSAETETCPPKFNNDLEEPVTKMKCDSISRIQHHSVIRSPQTKTAIFQYNGKKMGFASLESATSKDDDGFEPALGRLNAKAKDGEEDSNSDHVENAGDQLLIKSDVIDITKCREEIPPEDRGNQPATLDNKMGREELKVQIQKPQGEKSPACQNHQGYSGEEMPSETKNSSSDFLKKFNKGNVFVLDATREGNVGRFLNHSCCPNLLVQNVFVETHDRNFPLVAFFTNRYVKARTELTWDYGYEAGSMPEKEIPCQCGVNKCIFKIVEKMKKRTCALCPSNLECGVLYFAEKENIVAHENCLLYSSGLVECEVHVPFNHERNFDVGSVKKEISRGKWLTCSSCGEKGATVGCDVKACKRQYHFFCALSDSAAPDQYTYRVLCHEHKNSTKTHSGDIGGQTQDLPCGKRAPNHLSHSRPPGDSGASAASEEEERSADPHFPQPKETPCLSSPQEVTEERGKDTDVNGKAAFLKKCKEAGLLNDLFEVLLEKLIFIHERLMDDTTSEEGYEEIGTSLLGCRLFEDTFVNFQAAIENKIRQCEEKQQQMSTEIELLRDLKQTPCPL